MSELCILIIGLVGGVVCVIIGWLLSFLTESWRERERRKKLLKNLFHELKFNQGLISYCYLKDKRILINKSTSQSLKNKLPSLFIKIALKKEFGWGFQDLAYRQAVSETALIDLPVRCEISEIYRIIYLIKNSDIPKDTEDWKWEEIDKKLEYLDKSFKVTIENFYKNEKEWRKIISREMKKSSGGKSSKI